MKKVNVGCGYKIKQGWVNVDLFDDLADVKMDASNLTFEDESVDEILAEHILEHIMYEKTIATLDNWYRILKPGGTVTIAVPDLDFLFDEYKKKSYFSDITRAIFGPQNNQGQIHYTGFNFQTLKECLELAGFENVVRIETDHPHHLWVRATKKDTNDSR